MSDEPREVVEDPEETEEEREHLDPELAARRAAAMSFIRRLGDPVLKSRATAVDRFDDSLRTQVSRMGAIMNDALGVGLAAPQVGLSQRLLGPAPLFRLKGRERAQLLVKAPADGPDRLAAVRAVRHAVEGVAGGREHKGVAFSVDVDPQ